jgi:hypothetical protein
MVVVVAWVVVGHVTTGSSGRFESFYPSLAEADKSGAITRGWIPDEFLPRSSRSIHELHDLSPSTEWCAFEFVATDTQNILKNLSRVSVPPPAVKYVPSPGVSWWPRALNGELDSETIHNAGFELFVAERPATSATKEIWLFAIDRSKGRGFFYSKQL